MTLFINLPKPDIYGMKHPASMTVPPMTPPPQLDTAAFRGIDHEELGSTDTSLIRIALLYGSLRERSYSRFAVEEAARILRDVRGRMPDFQPVGAAAA